MKAFKKSLILLFAASIFSLANCPAFAQESFKLSDYKNPDYSYRALDFDFNLNGNNSLLRENFDNNLLNSITSTGFNAMFNPTYHARKNTTWYQGHQMGGLSFEPSWLSTKRTAEIPSFFEETSKNIGQLSGFWAHSTNRCYNQKQQFVELGFGLSSDSYYNKYDREYTPKTYPFEYKRINQHYTIGTNIDVMVGMGRIEEVQDARLAVYIIEDLEKSGDLTRKPDANEILQLAHFITSIKNERYFDQRLRHISEITAVDSLLDAMGLKGTSGASYYTLLNDNWSYSAGPVRNSGSRLSVGFGPSLYYRSDKDLDFLHDSTANQAQLIDYKNEWNETRTTTGLNIKASYIMEKPINLYWQNSTHFSAHYNISNEGRSTKYIEKEVVITDNAIENKFNSLVISASNTVGYYPNSRTNVQMGARASYYQTFFEFPENEDEGYSFIPKNIFAGIFASADYYVSPRLRLNLYFSSNARFETEKRKSSVFVTEEKIQNNSFSTSLMAGFVYSVF
jgi:hypothetical protein